MMELDFERTTERGSRGNAVRKIQEWLSLNGLGVVVDGDYGPATQFAVRQFQKANGLSQSGRATKATFEALTDPMRRATQSGDANADLGVRVIEIAEQHLSERPREIGGENCGPWVRLYMKGNQGRDWPWCAGFVSHVLTQACRELGVPLPIETSFSCDFLAASAKQKDRFVRESVADPVMLTPGTFFLVRRTSTDWTHVGIIVDADRDVMLTIEGNTNDSGSREGYQVCRRIRGYRDKDFVLID